MNTAPDTDPPGDVPRIRVTMPHQLRQLAGVHGEVAVMVARPVTVTTTLDALESAFPVLVGTVRDRGSGRRRAMIRIYADGEDYSDAGDDPLPRGVLEGREPLRLVGSIAGG